MFKKAIYLLLVFSIFFSILAPSTLANEGESESAIDGELNEGESVVDFTDINTTNVGYIPSSLPITLVPPPTLINPIDTMERQKSWYITSKSYQGLTYGGWLYAGASTTSGGSLSATHTRSVSNTFSGTLEVPLKTLTGSIGFDITDSKEVSVTYTSKEYPYGNYRLQYRHVYQTYNVKQDLKYDSRASVSYGTRYIYPKKWVERQYRVIKF